MKMNLVTPEKKILTGQEIDSVIVPAFRGELNILDGHTPMITTLDTGIIKWRVKGNDRFNYAVVSWGYCEVFPNGIDVLAEIADLPEDVNLEECKKYLETANKKIISESLDDDDFEAITREIRRVESDIELVQIKH